MTRARQELVSLETTSYYHCVCRCVRRAFLCGEDEYAKQNFDHRKAWIQERLIQLTDIFAIDIAAYAVMSNHYHVVLRIDKEKALTWTFDEVMDHWYLLFSGHFLADRYKAGVSLIPAERQALSDLVEQWRSRLYDLGWFMRCMNEHIARQANTEDTCTGRFWEGRYKSQALLDEAAVLACMAYVDLNPIRANMAETPEGSEFTSLYARIKATKPTSIRDKIKKSNTPSTQPKPKGLLPFTGGESMKSPENSLPYDFLDYLALVDWTGRAVREDKRGAIPDHLAPILLRLGIEPGNWIETVCHFEVRYYRVMGPVDKIRAYATLVGNQWFQGMSRCLQFYRASPT